MTDTVEKVARALFERDIEEDICDGTWEENAALHSKFYDDARAALSASDEAAQVYEQCAQIVRSFHGEISDKAREGLVGCIKHFQSIYSRDRTPALSSNQSNCK